MALRFQNSRVGLRNKETGKLVAVYPEAVTGDKSEVQRQVFDWFYKTGCSAETEMRNCIIDDVSSHELKITNEQQG